VVAEYADRLRRRLGDEIEPYRSLLEALVSGQLTPGEFETRFFTMWGDDERSAPQDAFEIFEEFFFAVEDYVDEERLRDPSQGDLGPEELKDRARQLLQRAGFDVPSR
jgi:hypothetical protein